VVLFVYDVSPPKSRTDFSPPRIACLAPSLYVHNTINSINRPNDLEITTNRSQYFAQLVFGTEKMGTSSAVDFEKHNNNNNNNNFSNDNL
jgi:hypothetical protein